MFVSINIYYFNQFLFIHTHKSKGSTINKQINFCAGASEFAWWRGRARAVGCKQSTVVNTGQSHAVAHGAQLTSRSHSAREEGAVLGAWRTCYKLLCVRHHPRRQALYLLLHQRLVSLFSSFQPFLGYWQKYPSVLFALWDYD